MDTDAVQMLHHQLHGYVILVIINSPPAFFTMEVIIWQLQNFFHFFISKIEISVATCYN